MEEYSEKEANEEDSKPGVNGNGKKRKLIRSVKLTSARDARKLLSRLINDTRRGLIDCERARVTGYLLKIFIDSFKTCDFEERIEALEKLVQERNRGVRY